MKCPLCSARRAKRRCPAERRDICSVCCGEKRLVEIPCPADCPHLVEGQQVERQRVWEEYARHQEPRKVRRWFEAMENLGPVVLGIEMAVRDAAAIVRDLTDAEASEALATLRQRYACESSGLIYEPTPPSPRVQAVVRSVRETLEELRREVEEEGGTALPAEALVESLRVIEDRVEYHRARAGGISFVTHVRRVHPPARDRARDGPGAGLIIP